MKNLRQAQFTFDVFKFYTLYHNSEQTTVILHTTVFWHNRCDGPFVSYKVDKVIVDVIQQF